jgi:hypothetical protein
LYNLAAGRQSKSLAVDAFELILKEDSKKLKAKKKLEKRFNTC